MKSSHEPSERQTVWDLIRNAHAAVLVTRNLDGALDARPMGCLQTDFDGTLWFMTFAHSEKLNDILADPHVLVSYADNAKYEYVSISGCARIVKDPVKQKELWREGLRVWFPKGPEDPDIALLAVKVDHAKYWTNAASSMTYALAYVKARLTGQRPKPDDIADTKLVEF